MERGPLTPWEGGGGGAIMLEHGNMVAAESHALLNGQTSRSGSSIAAARPPVTNGFRVSPHIRVVTAAVTPLLRAWFLHHTGKDENPSTLQSSHVSQPPGSNREK